MKHFHDAMLELKVFMYILSFQPVVYKLFPFWVWFLVAVKCRLETTFGFSWLWRAEFCCPKLCCNLYKLSISLKLTLRAGKQEIILMFNQCCTQGEYFQLLTMKELKCWLVKIFLPLSTELHIFHLLPSSLFHLALLLSWLLYLCSSSSLFLLRTFYYLVLVSPSLSLLWKDFSFICFPIVTVWTIISKSVCCTWHKREIKSTCPSNWWHLGEIII